MQVTMNPSTTNSSSANHMAASKPSSRPAASTQDSTNHASLSADIWEPSGLAPETVATGPKTTDNGLGFDMEAFKLETRRQLLEQVQRSKEELAKAGIQIRWSSDIPYQVDPEEKAAEVPEEWGADQTSQRIVDFALSMRQTGRAKDLSDEEFIAQVRSSIEEGFRSAKSELKDIPSPSAKLFNDTYEAAMKKLDQTLEDWKKAKEPTSSDSTPPPQTSKSETAKPSLPSGVQPFSVVA
ncbi:MAG: hypothetical protein IPK50_00275 [Fibrobacterota bacterium]|nr:hypothetical protein [Fibrobacterota bacterium]QQS05356.1 MAG: hypothetical protein IPK50_00275 [Fibrobacterota bacterium]